MSEPNPPDEDDSGYTSKNRTESLPTTGSVPDISTQELSSHSSENRIDVKHGENDLENEKLQEEENIGRPGVDESVIAGSTLSKFSTTPPSSNAKLSPLMTSTPVRASTPKGKDVQGAQGKGGIGQEMERSAGVENTERGEKVQQSRGKTPPNNEEEKVSPGQNTPKNKEEQNQGISGQNSPNRKKEDQGMAGQISQSNKEAKDHEILDKKLASEEKKERIFAARNSTIRRKKVPGALEKVLTSEKPIDRPPSNIMAARALKPKMPKGSKWSTALKLQEPKRTKQQSSPLWKIFLGSLGPSVINIEDTGSAVDAVIKKKPTTSSLARGIADTGSAVDAVIKKKPTTSKKSPLTSDAAEISKAESKEAPSPTTETEESESVSESEEAPSPTTETEESENVSESKEAPSPTAETKQSESVAESKETPSPITETEESESVSESEEAPSPTAETEQSESVSESVETPSPTTETEQSESVSERVETPSPTTETEQSESVSERVETPSPTTETEQSESVSERVETPSPTTETEQSESVSERVETPSPTIETEQSESVSESEEAPSPTTETGQSESVSGIVETPSITKETEQHESVSECMETPSPTTETEQSESVSECVEMPSPTTETEQSESISETSTVKETGNLEGTEKETNEKDLAVLSIESKDAEKTLSSTETPDMKVEVSTTAEPDKGITEEIAFEVPEELKKYIDSSTVEWQDPKSRKMIFQSAVQSHYINTGTTFEMPNACLWKPPKDLLIATYTKRDSLKTGAVHAPAENLQVHKGDLWKTMIKQNVEGEVPVSVDEDRRPSKPETGYLRKRPASSVDSLSGTADFKSKRSKILQGKCHSSLVLPEIEKGEADIVFSRRRKSDLGFCKNYTMALSKLVLDDSLQRRYKSLPDLNKGKQDVHVDFKLQEKSNSEVKKAEQNPEHIEQKGSSMVMDECVREDLVNQGISSDDPQNQGNKHKTDTTDTENTNISPSPNLELEDIKTMLKEKLDEQSAALKRQNLVTGILLQLLNRGKMLDDETFNSLYGADVIDLENITLKSIAMIEKNEEKVIPNNKTESNEKLSPITPQSHRNVDPSSPSEVLKRKLEKGIEDKVLAEKIARHIPSERYGSGGDHGVLAENDVCQYVDTSPEMSNNEMSTPGSSVYDKCFTGNRRFSGLSSGKSHPHLDDCDEEIISHYTHGGSSAKLVQRKSSDNNIYEMGSNLQLCNFISPSKETFEVPSLVFPTHDASNKEGPVKEMDVEPGALMSGLKGPKADVAKDVRFKDSLLYLESPVYVESAASLVASFKHRDSLLITENPNYLDLPDDGKEVQNEPDDNLQLPLRRASSMWNFLKLLYSRDPEFVRRSLDRAECGDETVQQLQSMFSDVDEEAANVDDMSESPRKRSLPSVSPRSMTPEARSWLMEKEVLENQTRKLQLEVSSLHAENNALKERLNRAQGTVESLEDKLVEKNEEVETAHSTLRQQKMEVENKVREEMSGENDRLQSQIQTLHQESLDLKTEVSTLEKHLDAAEKASSQMKLSAEKAKTLEASKMEILTLKEEVGRVKALLEQSENHLHEEEVRSKELGQQVLRLTEMKTLLQQQIDKGGGGTTSDKQQLRDLKSQYEDRLQQCEERVQDSQSQLTTFETTYKEQLNALVKEKHEFFARLKTTEDLLEALKGENEILKSNMAGSIGIHNSSNRDSQIEALNIEIKNLENRAHHLQTSNQVLEGEVTTLRVQLEAKEKALEEAQAEAHLATSRLGNTEAVERRQQRIEKLTTEIQNLHTDMRVLSEKNNSLITEKKRSDSDLSNCQREINMLKSHQKESKSVDLADNKFVQSLKEELQQKDIQLSQTTRDLQTLEGELQHTRHTMYSEQAHMANLQAQVDSLKERLEEKNSILDTIGGTKSDSQSHYNSLKETLESMSQELALVQAVNKTLDSEVNRERSQCEILQEDLSRAGGQTESREMSSLELQVKQLEVERKRLQEQLIEASKSGEELTQNMIDIQSESQRLQQDLSSEQAKLLHMSAQKGELEQHLEEIAEEHDALIQEKSQSEEDLVKLEKKLQEIVQMFEMEALRQHNNFQTHYSDIPPELRKMGSELDTIRTMLDSKNGELEMLQDKLSRQNMETDFLQRRVELLQSENQCNREDIARLTGELANKIKETGSLKEVNQLLSRERNKIQRQREAEEKEKMWERTHNEKYRKEVSDVIHKADLQKYQRECEDFRAQLHVTTVELETAKAQLAARDETIESLKQDKGAFYQEYDSMCRRLAEKDEKIENLQRKCDTTVETLKQEFSQEKLNLEQERTSTESDLDKAKETIDTLNEEVKQKDAQLVTFGRTLHELEELTKQKHELEHQVEKLEFDCSSLKQLLQNSEREVQAHQSTINRMQEVHAKLQVDKTKLTDQLKEEKASSANEIQALMKAMSDERSRHEGEKAYLKENLSQTQSKLHAMETSLASAIETRDKFHMTNRMLEHSLEETKGKLQEESTCYRVSEKKTETLQSQLNDSRRERCNMVKFLTEDKLNQCQTSVVKLEKEIRAEKDRAQELGERILELEALSATQQSTLNSKQEQLDVLQSEISKLRQIIDGQKQQLGGKLKKSAHEFKQQLDLVEMEKEQLSKQNQQLTFDLEKARETIQNKNKDNLKLQEDILNLEDQIRERSSKLRKVEDNLKVEEEIQTKLASRYQEQEDEVKRLKIFLTKKAEEATDADKSMWQDMSKVIQDMSLKMQQHFEGSKERENQREQDLKLIKKYKKQVRDLETDLNTEKAVHTITKSSLQALEEDCQRLRKQFMASRRRGQTSTDKQSKSRMEAINEIIARSHTQAQNMLAAGGYFEETLRSITTPRGGDYNHHNNDGSPDTSIASDFSFNSVPAGVMTTYPSQAKSPRK